MARSLLAATLSSGVPNVLRRREPRSAGVSCQIHIRTQRRAAGELLQRTLPPAAARRRGLTDVAHGPRLPCLAPSAKPTRLRAQGKQDTASDMTAARWWNPEANPTTNQVCVPDASRPHCGRALLQVVVMHASPQPRPASRPQRLTGSCGQRTCRLPMVMCKDGGMPSMRRATQARRSGS
jgi:hypothetical protein